MTPNANIYPMILAGLFCVSFVGAFASGAFAPFRFERIGTLLMTIFFCTACALTFESSGAISSAFALCLTLGILWDGREDRSFKVADLLRGVCVSFVCAGGIWLVFNRIFGLVLP